MTQWLVRRGLLATVPVASLVLAFGACSSEMGAPEPGESAEGSKPIATGQELGVSTRASERIARLTAQFNRTPKQLKTVPQKYPPGFIPPKPAPAIEPSPVLSKGEATRFLQSAGRVRAEVDAALKKETHQPASVELPVRADGFVRIQADSSTMGVEFALKGARREVELEVADGNAIYANAAPEGGDVLMRVTKNSVEDFVVLNKKPAAPYVDYTVNVSEVAGLRLYANTLEFLAKNGDPQVRVHPPVVIDADGVSHDAKLALLNCKADTSGEDPWDRPVTAAGASECTLRVSWDESKLIYPAIVDPVWASAADMGTARYQFPAIRLGNGRTLVCGGLNTNGDPLATCETFNPAGGASGEGSWAVTTAMGTARYNFNFVLLNATNVLAVGGEGLYTSERYNSTIWTASTGDYSAIPCLTCGGTIHPAMTSDGAYVVLISYNGYPYVYTAATNSWTAGSVHPAPVASYRYGAQLIAIPGQNTILRAGGYWYPVSSAVYLKSAERYRPSGDPLVVAAPADPNPWTSPGDAASMDSARGQFATMPLDANRLMVYGGSNFVGTNSKAEIYSGSGNTWSYAAGDLPDGGGASQNGRGKTYALHTASGKFLLNPDSGPYIYDPVAATAPFYRIDTYQYSFYPYYSTGNVTTAGTKVLMVPVQPQGSNAQPQKACRLFDFGDKGSFCSSTGECKAGLTCVYDDEAYVDGKSVCCDTACTDACSSCRAANKTSAADEGTCGPRKTFQYVGTDDCPQTEQSTCGTSGYYCDGAGSCAKWDTNTYCGNASCVDADTQNNIRYCDGQGSCPAQTTTDCSTGYACIFEQCRSYCNDDSYCQTGYFCQFWSPDYNTCQPKKANGATCTGYTNSECSEGNCVEGVCCDAACDGLCQSCLNSQTGQTTGTCNAVTAAAGYTGDCGDYGAGSCGQNGKCDGAGACQLYASGTQCADIGSCASETSRYIPDTCNGTGTCSDKGSANCTAGYSCQNGVCNTQCTTDTQCASNHWCDTITKVCVADRAQGQSCARDAVCSGNANCVDGVCCDSTCTGSCRSCLKARTGLASDGLCGNILDDTDPENECVTGAAYPNSCAAPGLCNEAGSCRPYAKAGIECDTDVCTGSTLTTYECNGAGTCKPKSLQCYPFKCDTTNNVCRVACTVATQAQDCIDGSFCSNGTCVGQLANGSACTSGPQCETGFCANVGEGVLEGQDTGAGGDGAGGAAGDPGADSPGVCCDEQCQGTCSGCKASIKGFGSDGICEFVKNNTDPANDCDPALDDKCGLDGQCTGTGACRLAPSGTSCGASSCQGNSVLGQSCNGQGDCINNQGGVDCAPYVCRDVLGAFQCTQPCADDNDCQDGYFCEEALCKKKLANGKACETSGVCNSGYCVDGLCCDASCNGQCEACDAAGSEGVCTAVQGAPRGNRAQCDHAGEECGGSCDGVNAASCKYVTNGEACGSATCTNAIADSSACDGQGSCRANKPQRCAPFNCGDDDTCLTGCQTEDQCSPGYTCDETTQQCLPAAVAAECSEDRQASVGNNGISTPCKPFLCVPASGTCAVSCAFTTDCGPDFVCEASTKTCLPAPPDAGSGEEEGCACRAAGAPSPRSNYWALAAFGLALTAMRRRRTKKSPTLVAKPARFESGPQPSESADVDR